MKYPFREVSLGSVEVLDIAKVDRNHIVASMGTTLDIWKRSQTHGFAGLQCVRACWRESTPIQLVVPRQEDSACLIAGGTCNVCRLNCWLEDPYDMIFCWLFVYQPATAFSAFSLTGNARSSALTQKTWTTLSQAFNGTLERGTAIRL